MIDKLMI